MDWDSHCCCATHRANFPSTIVVQEELRNVRGDEILTAAKSQIDLVAGGPNCQGVSQRGLRSPNDARLHVPRICSPNLRVATKPAFLMENVPGLVHRHNFHMLRAIFRAFKDLGYSCAADVLLAADYECPNCDIGSS